MESFSSWELVTQFILWLMLIVVAVIVATKKDLLSSAIYMAIYSLVVATIFLVLDAPDVAITEAAIGSAISFLFYLATFRIVKTEEPRVGNYKFLSLATCVLMFALIAYIMSDMPQFGDVSSPANAYLGRYYVNNTMSDTGVPNAVTSVLASYRGYDTLGETYVILAAALAVLLILPSVKKAEKVKA